ncbi:hypothetical protein GGR92_003484 [Spirosoma lacussanchae]|uniref:DUF7149 domain-containing protein n=1 Tax=Spirosoma lacussanchae TaxID=1884249 RepID=UPI001109E358|nr:class I SAM-dependent DNA methyltransferase [Spirosoma lacussanchae]
MRLSLRKPAQALHKAYAKQSVPQGRLDTFRRALARLFSRLDEHESEEYQKSIVAGFLIDAFSAEGDPAHPFARISRHPFGLVLQPDDASDQSARVVIGTKKVFAGEMMTTLKNNVRALHELILYYFDQQTSPPGPPISQLIITDVYNWFIFDADDFRRYFYQNTRLQRLNQLRQQSKRDPAFFYGEVAKVLRDMPDEVPVTCLDLRKVADALNLPPAEANPLLIPVYKLLSPRHLYQWPVTNEAPAISPAFYHELLHITGLYDATHDPNSVPGQPLVGRRPEGDRHDGSLLESLIRLAQAQPAPIDPDQTAESVALTLCLTWLARILFVKLAEGQLISYHRGDRSVQFLTPRHIRTFEELDELFFDVLATPGLNRSASLDARYGPVPYLNSGWMEPTEAERQGLRISALTSQPELPLFGQTILTDQQGNRLTEPLPLLQYLLSFLNAHDFLADGPAGVLPENKSLISPATLNDLFERFSAEAGQPPLVPSPAIDYLVRQTIRKLVISRFNEQFGWDCTAVASLADRLKEVDLSEANALVNRVRLVDPAAGSGRWLAAALNELVALKAELGILIDPAGRRLSQYDITVADTELIIADASGELFRYQVPQSGPTGIGGARSTGATQSPRQSEIQRVQEAIFWEKQTMLTQCLLGVDSRIRSVLASRLRLSVELLRHSYVIMPAALPATAVSRTNGASPLSATLLNEPAGEWLEPIPNLDMVIWHGNALVSRFATDFRVESVRNQLLRDRFPAAWQQYRHDVNAFGQEADPVRKDQLRNRLRQFRELTEQLALVDQKEYTDIRQLETRLAQATQTFDFVTPDEAVQGLTQQLTRKKRAYQQKQTFYRQGFDWRFEWPAVLDEAGTFVGFDLVIGQPPTGRPDESGEGRSLFRKTYPNTYTSRTSLYQLYIERGLSLLRPNGWLAYALPASWMEADAALPLRAWLRTKAIEEVVELPGLTADTILLTVRQASASETFRGARVDTGMTDLGEYLARHAFPVRLDTLSGAGWQLTDSTRQALLTRLSSLGQPLGAYLDESLFAGLRTGFDRAFVIDATTRNRLLADDPRSAELIRPYLTDRNLRPYQPLPSATYLIATRRGVDIGQYPAVLAHLETYRERLMPKPDGLKGGWKGRQAGAYAWYELPDLPEYDSVHDQPHLVVAPYGQGLVATWAEAGMYSGHKTTLVVPASAYVLAVLNARVAQFMLRSQKGTVTPEWLAQLPVPPASETQLAQVETLVDTIRTMLRNDPKADTSVPEQALDELMAELYGLTREERTKLLSERPSS